MAIPAFLKVEQTVVTNESHSVKFKMQKISPIQKYTLAWGSFHLILNEFYVTPLPLRICEANPRWGSGIWTQAYWLLLCVTDTEFLQIKNKPLHPQNNYNSLYCDILLQGSGTKPAISPRYTCTWMLWFSCLVEFLIERGLLFNWYIFSANNTGGNISLLCFVSSMISFAFASLPRVLRWPLSLERKRSQRTMASCTTVSPRTLWATNNLFGSLPQRPSRV